MEKEEIIKLAKEIGFQSQFLHNKPYKYSNKEDLRWLFWLTELQKWLREIHNFHITVSEVWKINNDYNLTGEIDFFESFGFNGDYETNFVFSPYNSHIEAFEMALYYVLSHINNKK